MPEPQNILHCQCELGEGPLWNARESALYFVNILAGELHRLHLPTGEHQSWRLPATLGVAALRASGGFIMATGIGLGTWQPGAELRILAHPEAQRKGARFNDGAVDPQGRFWAGTIHNKVTPDSALYRLDPNGSVHIMETGIRVSNGIGWSPDGSTMYYTDSLAYAIYAYDFDGATGSIYHRRQFARIPEGEGVPDGLAVDSEGYVWSARWGGWKVVRYNSAGKVDGEIHLPVECPSSCAFGGEGLDELFITSAYEDFSPSQRKAQPQAGDLFRVNVGVKGQLPFAFAG